MKFLNFPQEKPHVDIYFAARASRVSLARKDASMETS